MKDHLLIGLQLVSGLCLLVVLIALALWPLSWIFHFLGWLATKVPWP